MVNSKGFYTFTPKVTVYELTTLESTLIPES